MIHELTSITSFLQVSIHQRYFLRLSLACHEQQLLQSDYIWHFQRKYELENE